MSAPPKTVLTATPEEERAIRDAVRNADPLTLGPGRIIANETHAAGVLDLFADTAVSEPIYDLPRPFTLASIAAWIAESERQRQTGDGLLILTATPDGTVMGYSKISVWPDRASAELGGAIRATLQNSGAGGSGAAHTIGWIFTTLKVRLIGLTAALDNIRSAKLIDRIGFRRLGERESIRPDGTIRRSLYWEMTAAEWVAKRGEV
ncbi:MAG: GNAT family N-acetyltransferase [Alphaproteobacteria bacterium]|nr:GNAT family N-acetyltransferase [Alphaproteobacteria bacterium]